MHLTVSVSVRSPFNIIKWHMCGDLFIYYDLWTSFCYYLHRLCNYRFGVRSTNQSDWLEHTSGQHNHFNSLSSHQHPPTAIFPHVNKWFTCVIHEQISLETRNDKEFNFSLSTPEAPVFLWQPQSWQPQTQIRSFNTLFERNDSQMPQCNSNPASNALIRRQCHLI